MKISIVSGFFLPVPPHSGGSTEKSWFQLAHEFVTRGHEITMISRRWGSLPHEETVGGIRHLRLPGHDHTRSLPHNVWLDFRWSWRVFRSLPLADIAVVHAVSLPVWLGRLKPAAGKVVVMPGRIPKGQYRYYRRVARVVAPSSQVRELVIAENPTLASITRVFGYPINWSLLSRESASAHPFVPTVTHDELTIGYVGRLHEEKGLDLLAKAVEIVGRRTDLPPWRIVLCGPADVAQGGSGIAYRAKLLARLSSALHPDRVHVLDPQFNECALATIYRQIDIFCLPSLAEQGETFGVAAAEAMAAGATPVVSGLRCFGDLVRHDETGLVFDHRSSSAADALGHALERLLRDTTLRRRLAAAAQAFTRRYDYPDYAAALLTDFAALSRH